jgi:ketosteroid isomerase-like protein
MSAKEAEIESAKAAIQALNQQWEKNFENHDLVGLTALFTEDCVRMPQGGPATVGRSALEAAYRRDFAEVWKTRAKVRLNPEEVIIAGEYAFARGADTLVQDQDDRRWKRQASGCSSTASNQMAPGNIIGLPLMAIRSD